MQFTKNILDHTVTRQQEFGEEWPLHRETI